MQGPIASFNGADSVNDDMKNIFKHQKIKFIAKETDNKT